MLFWSKVFLSELPSKVMFLLRRLLPRPEPRCERQSSVLRQYERMKDFSCKVNSRRQLRVPLREFDSEVQAGDRIRTVAMSAVGSSVCALLTLTRHSSLQIPYNQCYTGEDFPTCIFVIRGTCLRERRVRQSKVAENLLKG